MQIGNVLRKWRLMEERDIRSTAKELGMDQATYHRVEQGKMPSAETLRTILNWLMKD